MKKHKKKITIGDMLEALNSMSNMFAKKMNEAIFSNPISIIKPLKFWYEPVFTIKIPYPYIDEETYDDYGGGGRKGLFIGWHEINIGKRKIINKNYKEQYKKWKSQNSGTIKFSRYGDLK